MENIGLDSKTNFFEKRVAEYSKPGVGDSAENKIIDSISDDF